MQDFEKILDRVATDKSPRWNLGAMKLNHPAFLSAIYEAMAEASKEYKTLVTKMRLAQQDLDNCRDSSKKARLLKQKEELERQVDHYKVEVPRIPETKQSNLFEDK